MPTVEVPLKLDTTEFEATFAEYLKVSRRDYATAVNTKLFYIARRAVRETPQAVKMAIGRELSGMLFTFGTKGKKSLVKVVRFGRYGQQHSVPLAALLINKRRREQGKPGLYGPRMTRAIKGLISGRQRTVSYLKSGWLPAIRELEPLAEKAKMPDMGEKPKRYGIPKGRAIAARAGDAVQGLIANSIGERGRQAAKQSAALQKYGGPALQRAVDAESRSMLEYMNSKAYEAARKLGIAAKS